ncbi:MAG: TRAP transporter substrate-binding protein [Dongiaceae bacterium]
MKIRRRRFLNIAGGALAAPFLWRGGTARAAEVTLKMHHLLPPMAAGPSRFLAPWAKKVEAESDQRIKIDIYPSMQLGGTPPQLFDQARDGVVDLIWSLPGYTAGRFPRLETFELPFVAARRAIVNAQAVQEFTDTHLGDELAEVHPICVWAHDRGVVHCRKKVTSLEDLAGLKIRFPTRLAGEALQALGASPIGMPVPQVPESLAQGVIDGCVVPWEVVPGLKLQELVTSHTEIPGSPTFYTATFFLVMNKARYEGLPADLKAVIDANSGLVAARMAGTAWDEAAIPGMEAAKSRGNEIVTLTEEEAGRWREKTKPVWDTWLAGTKDRGFDGGKLLEDAQALIAKYDQA